MILLPAKTVHNRLLLCEKWLPAETVHVIVYPAESLGRKQNHVDSLSRKPFFTEKQTIVDSLDRSHI